MFIISNLIVAIANVLELVLSIFWWLLLIRVFISWVSPDPFNPVVQFLYRSTEPVLEPIRRALPPMGMIDFSPIAAFILIVFLKSFFIQTLLDIALHLRS